jgi:hypothetical protein
MRGILKSIKTTCGRTSGTRLSASTPSEGDADQLHVGHQTEDQRESLPHDTLVIGQQHAHAHASAPIGKREDDPIARPWRRGLDTTAQELRPLHHPGNP